MIRLRVSMREQDGKVHRRGRILGWVSLGLGVIQLAAPNAVRRMSGVDDSATSRVMVPLVGGRELLHATGLLASRRPGPWAWTRVAGDAMDLTSLSVAMAHRDGARRRRLAGVTGAVVGLTAVDVLTAVQATRAAADERALHLYASVTVNRSPDEAYRLWRDFANLPRFMAHLQSVRVTGDRTSHWAARGPAGTTVEWDAEITEDEPGRRIGWNSLDGATVPNSGTVRFAEAPGGRGAEVRVEIDYRPPGGKLGRAVAAMFGEEPEQQVRDDLRRFKQVIETGEVVRSEGSPEGPLALRLALQRPAQPPAASRS